MTNDGTASSQTARFIQQLLAIREDPQVKSLARARAGNPDVAEDALQEAFYTVARAEHPEQIANLRAYFCTVMIRMVYRLRTEELRAESRPADPAAPLEKDQYAGAAPEQAQARPADESTTGQLAEEWRERLSAHRDRLTATVPGRSPDPGRYRNVILSVVERVLSATSDLGDDEADSSKALRVAYPEWFAEESCAAASQAQRLARARSDVRNLLLAVIRPKAGSRAGASRHPDVTYGDVRSGVRVTAQRDERGWAADDGIISALFRQAEQVRLALGAPYNLERELELFTEWLDGEE